MNYDAYEEPIYKDLTGIIELQRKDEPLVIDLSGGLKDISQQKIDEILSFLKNKTCTA